jgi:hypothetical protein
VAAPPPPPADNPPDEDVERMLAEAYGDHESDDFEGEGA